MDHGEAPAFPLPSSAGRAFTDDLQTLQTPPAQAGEGWGCAWLRLQNVGDPRVSNRHAHQVQLTVP